MLKVAIVGMGFMGRTHLRCWNDLDGAEVIAICDTNIDSIKNSKEKVGNIDTGSDAISFDGIKLYDDFDKLLAAGGFDAISLTLPTHLHCDLTVKALKAGYHVLCEKPMAINIDTCQKMIDATNATGKKLMIGHCIRFWPEYAVTKDIIDSGKYGDVIKAEFTRISPIPTWSVGNWMASEEKSGGMALDLHIHDSDYVQYLFGMPKAVKSVNDTPEAVAYIKTNYVYNGKDVWAVGAWYSDPDTQFVMSFEIKLAQATIKFNCNNDPAFEVVCADGTKFTPEVSSGDGYSRQIEYFAALANGSTGKEIITPEQSRDSVALIAAEVESLGTSQTVKL
ncbi:MAG: Gfo/Idh/MocA family oxidoreductase [Phycisphaerae bacterium]|nr:Gfo/Idh/MocA family oxidoreductase [Phycisphaerae bacterium]